MRDTAPYGTDFFATQQTQSRLAAEKMLRLVFDRYPAKSVVDLGCGVGTWSAASLALGSQQARGIDGDWVPRNALQIPASSFSTSDLEASLPPPELHDLAICVEVLEHLTDAAGERAVEWLCKSARVVVFSAAIPEQGGTHHINEQWQSYWADRFSKFGYQCFDLIRPYFWTDTTIPFWYRQNILVYSRLSDFGNPAKCVDVVHPELYENLIRRVTRRRKRSLGFKLKSALARTGVVARPSSI
mgnify:CR=1 FL=1